ncbi:MAG: F0F1 ATP synthase subunit gamma [Anaerolineales bacterium]|nr:F0F1 ATP synthase subunit gamma [Anaerolineales bacterium]
MDTVRTKHSDQSPMADDLEQTQARLDNIRGVEPMLEALRTISLGSWQAALKRKTVVTRYRKHIARILPSLAPHLLTNQLVQGRKIATSSSVIALVIGSERGLCGRFNAAIAEFTDQYLARQESNGVRVEIWALGSRVVRILERRQRPISWSSALSATSPPPYHLAFDLVRYWLSAYERGNLGSVDVLYNVHLNAGRYTPSVERLFPLQIELVGQTWTGEPWPPPIIETEPRGLVARIIEQLLASVLYESLLNSSVAEHSARYQLMEEAEANIKRLSAELTVEVQMARRNLITQEMQELAAGAGMIKSR